MESLAKVPCLHLTCPIAMLFPNMSFILPRIPVLSMRLNASTLNDSSCLVDRKERERGVRRRRIIENEMR
jgi:hypothetical protein